MQSSEPIGTKKPDAGPAESLGERLRRARETQDLSLDAVSAELRISVPALTALEECRFDALGPPVFAKGYLKQYGARLGLDVDDLIAEYQRMAGDTSVELEPSKTIRLTDERQIMFWVLAGLALLLAAAILATWWWLGRGVAADLAAEGARPDPAAVTAEPEPVAEPAAITEPPRVETPPPADTPVPAAAAATDVPSRQEAHSVPTLEIIFVEDSWTEITDAAGERLYYALGRAGTRATIPADRDLNLFFGNAAGVELRLGGEPVPIPARSRRGDLAQFDFEARTGQAP